MKTEFTNDQGETLCVAVDETTEPPVAILTTTERADDCEDRVARICLPKKGVNAIIRLLVAARGEL